MGIATILVSFQVFRDCVGVESCVVYVCQKLDSPGSEVLNVSKYLYCQTLWSCLCVGTVNVGWGLDVS